MVPLLSFTTGGPRQNKWTMTIKSLDLPQLKILLTLGLRDGPQRLWEVLKSAANWGTPEVPCQQDVSTVPTPLAESRLDLRGLSSTALMWQH